MTGVEAMMNMAMTGRISSNLVIGFVRLVGLVGAV
jgi:hypothetical protein